MQVTSKFASRLSKAREDASSGVVLREARDDVPIAKRIGGSKPMVNRLSKSVDELPSAQPLPMVRRKPSVITTLGSEKTKLVDEPTTSAHRNTRHMPSIAPSAKPNAMCVLTQLSQPSASSPPRSRIAQIRALPKNLSPVRPGTFIPMIPSPLSSVQNRITLCVDIDETLVHSSFVATKPYDVVIPITVDGQKGKVYVKFRPNLLKFLEFIGQMFEVVIFTASLSCYADGLMDHLDPNRKLGNLRLFREHCTDIDGSYAKDLSLLGRSLDRIALLDNSPCTYMFQQRNGIPIESWFDDPADNELMKLKPLLTKLAECEEVFSVLDEFNSLNL